MKERPCYSDQQCERIGIHIAPTKRADVVAGLHLAWKMYLGRKNRDVKNTEERAQAWTRISTKFRELNQELRTWEDPERPVLALKAPEHPVQIGDQEVAEHAAQGSLLRELMLRMENESRWEASFIASSVRARKGGADPRREELYGEVLSIWTIATGIMRRAPAKTKTGGPQAQFFLAAVGPILGDEVPKLTSLKAIFEREIERRKEGTAYFIRAVETDKFFASLAIGGGSQIT